MERELSIKAHGCTWIDKELRCDVCDEVFDRGHSITELRMKASKKGWKCSESFTMNTALSRLAMANGWRKTKLSNEQVDICKSCLAR